MKVSSDQLYGVLRIALAPIFKHLGFKRAKGGRLGWTRPYKSHHLVCWFQCDHYGWFPCFGSSFTFELRLSGEPQASTGSIASLVRFPMLLTAEERETIRALNNGVLSSLPLPGPTHPFLMVQDAQGREVLLNEYRPSVTPYPANSDIWLHYYSLQDTEKWAEWFKEAMPTIIERYIAHVCADAA